MITGIFVFFLSIWFTSLVIDAIPELWLSRIRVSVKHLFWWLLEGRHLKVNDSERRARELRLHLLWRFSSVAILERVEISPYTRAAVCDVDGYMFVIGMNDFSPNYILIRVTNILQDRNQFRASFELAKKLELLPSDPNGYPLIDLPGKIREAMLLEKI